MNRYQRLAVAAALPLLGAAGCNDFLTGNDELTKTPNSPIDAAADILFAGVQSTQWVNQTTEDARTVSMWMQQMMGTTRQYQSLATYASYTEDTFHGFGDIYAGGGLIDMRKIQTLADSAGTPNRVLKGVVQVLEALAIGTAADLYGDIPYSEAVTPGIEEPVLDPQLLVYAAIQVVLDEAIGNLESGQGGTPASDLVYTNDLGAEDAEAAWIELAYTLKARFYAHTAEVDAGAYAQVLANVPNGISTPAHDYHLVLTGEAGSQNPWYQFIVIQRQGYIAPAATLVNLLKSRNDPRLQEYFSPGSEGTFRGAELGEADKNELSGLSAERLAQDFEQPIVTHVENLLLWAEAAYQTGDQATALAKLNEARATDGLPPVGLSGTALFTEIMTEKYIQLFQQLEVWNDYKRTCIPNLVPGDKFTVIPGDIPARSLYPSAERQTNSNVPEPSAQPSRNANDPLGGVAPGPGASACLGANGT